MNYQELNKKAWDLKTDQHVNSDFYELEAFLNGKNVLRNVELELLGDVQGQNVLHLQCHFGLDSLSLARMGAKITGVDLSEKAIQKAKEINELIGNKLVQHLALRPITIDRNMVAPFENLFANVVNGVPIAVRRFKIVR